MRLAMKHENIMEYVDQRLHEWALWYSKDNMHGLGYRSCTLEYRLMTEGIVVNFTGIKPLPINEEADEIERLVNEMTSHNKLMAFALRNQYFDVRGSRIKAKEFGMGYTRFRNYVDMAKQWLAGRLSAADQFRG